MMLMKIIPVRFYPDRIDYSLLYGFSHYLGIPRELKLCIMCGKS